MLFGEPEKIYGRVWNSRGILSDEFHDAFIAHFYYPPKPSLRPTNSIPLTVVISSATLSLVEPQIRFRITGTKASYIKYGLDVQEEQLKYKPPMSLDDPRFAVEPKSLEGVLTNLNDNGEMISSPVPTERGD